MCGPTDLRDTKRVVVSGAGPSGLLTALLLLARNDEPDASVTYNVTLVDSREDYGSITKADLAKNHRSWMLGLADHGLDAIKTLPDLYEKYVQGEGVLVEELNLFMGKKKISQSAVPDASQLERLYDGKAPQGFVVDRNFIVAALARCLKEKHESNDNFTALYSTTCQYVDYANKQVLVRDLESKKESYLSYDLIIGCDGVRSTVREALTKRHSDFSCEVTDIFQEFKAVHVELPKEVSEKAMSLLPDILPCCQGIGLPETNGFINISIGCPRNMFDELPKELKSSDYKVVSKYVKEHFKAFELTDYDDFAKQWADQRWNQTGMVHCNFYHSLETGVVIMGDAAHATSPSVGMGMNTALRDAQVFYELLKENEDDFTKVLPAFSEARTKEGNALSDLAFHLYSLDKTQQTKATFHLVIRSILNSKFPSLVAEHPQSMIGRRGVGLSDVYNHAVKLGIINKQRAINNRIRMEYFEKKTGMVTADSKSKRWRIVLGAGLVALSAVIFQRSASF